MVEEEREKSKSVSELAGGGGGGEGLEEGLVVGSLYTKLGDRAERGFWK